MSLTQTRQSFQEGKLLKHDYIREMHQFHRTLYEYPELMKGTDISKIEITDEGVIMTVRRTGIRMLCDKDDQRIAPIEILNFGAYEETDSRMMRAFLPTAERSSISGRTSAGTRSRSPSRSRTSPSTRSSRSRRPSAT